MEENKCEHLNTLVRYDFSVDLTMKVCLDCGEVMFIEGDDEHDYKYNSSN